jgi:hypothetical protein
MRTTFLLVAAVSLFMVAGCIVSDQITTITIQPDGSADWVKFQSNIRSTASGAKAAEELKQFVEDFNAHKDSDYMHITESGGEIIDARWVRPDEPYSNMVVARFPNWTALQEFATFKDEKGEVIAQAQFVQNGNRRRLSLVIPLSDEEKANEQSAPTIEQLRQEQADSISETRLVVAGGRIIASQGFIVAKDRRSALLDPAAVRDSIRSAGDKIELYLEWELVRQ